MREDFFKYPWLLPYGLNVQKTEGRSTDYLLHILFIENELGSYPNLKEKFSHLTFAKHLFGELEESKLYPVDADANSYVMVVSHSGLAADWVYDKEELGKGHLSYAFGATCGSFVDQCKTFPKGCQISVEVHSENGEEVLGQQIQPHQFVAGMISGGIANKLQPNVPQKNVFLKIAQDQIAKGQHLAYGQMITRTLVNLPPNQLRPDSYEEYVKQIVDLLGEECLAEGSVQYEVFDEAKLRNDGASLLLAVGQASDSRPRLLKLSWIPKDSVDQTVALVGKGITFDSGGLNLKPGGSMRLMKKDMGGSAAVFGAFVASCLRRVNKKLVAWIPLAENMVSSNSFRPGDVHTSLSGKNVEIDNTDAEGRLILADALTYAVREKPSLLVDVATLTGAARVALGPQIDPIIGNSKTWIEKACKIGSEVGDLVWHLPRAKFYKKYLDSSIADSVNSSSSGFAGAITAALFLEQFVEDVPWLHIDSYMWTDKPNHLTREPGACPRTVRLLVELVETMS